MQDSPLAFVVFIALTWLGLKLNYCGMLCLVGFLSKEIYEHAVMEATAKNAPYIWTRGSLVVWALAFFLGGLLDFSFLAFHFEWR